jgi:hypothetical protein
MKLKSYIAAFLSVAVMGTANAGNPQRAGSAGAGELLINPFARSAGWGSVNVARCYWNGRDFPEYCGYCSYGFEHASHF